MVFKKKLPGSFDALNDRYLEPCFNFSSVLVGVYVETSPFALAFNVTFDGVNSNTTLSSPGLPSGTIVNVLSILICVSVYGSVYVNVVVNILLCDNGLPKN